MRTILYNDFLSDKFSSPKDLNHYLLMHGIEGLLNEFEEWLVEMGHLK